MYVHTYVYTYRVDARLAAGVIGTARPAHNDHVLERGRGCLECRDDVALVAVRVNVDHNLFRV